MEEKDELLQQSQREHKAAASEVKLLGRRVEGLERTGEGLRAEIAKRDTLIQEHGLIQVRMQAAARHKSAFRARKAAT